MTYRAFGKQVKRGDEHIADAADETYAQIIADALNGERGHTGGPITLGDAPAYTIGHAGPEYIKSKHHMMRQDNPPHHWQRQQDEYACSCGARWDVADGDDHP